MNRKEMIILEGLKIWEPENKVIRVQGSKD
jgi:hypothetical protein